LEGIFCEKGLEQTKFYFVNVRGGGGIMRGGRDLFGKGALLAAVQAQR